MSRPEGALATGTVPIVFDNIVYNLQRAGGISRFWSRITEPYLQRAVFIERQGAQRNIYRQEQHLGCVEHDHRWPERMSRYLNFNHAFHGGRFIFHSSYYRINRASGSINVTTIHDLIYEKFGVGMGRRLHLRQKAAALRASSCIVCISNHTKVDLLEHYPFCADKQVHVISNGVDQDQPSPASGALAAPADPIIRSVGDTPFFLYVGHRGACKGFDRVHSALEAVSPTQRCVVVGEPFDAEESACIAARGHVDRIVNVGKVSDSTLRSLYARASFFFFPSLYEGFGIPPLEAMQAGCPVIASDRSSVPEVVGDAGLLFDPDDDSAIRRAVEDVMQPRVRQPLIERGLERARQFSWQVAVDSYARLYSNLLHEA